MDMHGAAHVVGVMLGCAIGWVFGYVAGRRAMTAWLAALLSVSEPKEESVERRASFAAPATERGEPVA